MLSLAPPYYIYQGVPVFADAQDPHQFYYLPNRPILPSTSRIGPLSGLSR